MKHSAAHCLSQMEGFVFTSEDQQRLESVMKGVASYVRTQITTQSDSEKVKNTLKSIFFK